MESANNSPEPTVEPSPEALLNALTQVSPSSEAEVGSEDLLGLMISEPTPTRSVASSIPAEAIVPPTKPIGKTPTGAMMLCLVVYPGAGHLSCGFRNRGIFWMVFFTLMTLVVLYLGAYNVWMFYQKATSITDIGTLGAISWGPFLAATVATVLTWGVILVDTYLCASKQPT